jgi:AcrR family transcriptional regulator
MPDTMQGGSLAGTHDGKPGLPRGRSRLPVPDVRASQLRRLRRATIAAVAEAGYAAVTVADIVRRAKVSRAAFYAHFADKEDAFLAATREGGQLMSDRVVAATRALPAGAPDEDVLRAGCRAFLEFLVDEPAFARVFYVDMPTAGPRAVERFDQADRRFAAMTATWHARARTRHPEWPAVPADAYQALAGAYAELVRSRVRAGRTQTLPELEDTLVSLHLAVLAAKPWPPPAALPRARAAYSPMPPSFLWPLSRLRAMVRRWISSVPS